MIGSDDQLRLHGQSPAEAASRSRPLDYGCREARGDWSRHVIARGSAYSYAHSWKRSVHSSRCAGRGLRMMDKQRTRTSSWSLWRSAFCWEPSCGRRRVSPLCSRAVQFTTSGYECLESVGGGRVTSRSRQRCSPQYRYAVSKWGGADRNLSEVQTLEK